MTIQVPGAARALRVFEIFAVERRELSNTELARLLNLPESSCSDLVATLMECGYLARSAGTRRLYPTSKYSSVGANIRQDEVLERQLLAGAESLRDRTGESTLCGRIEDGAVKVLVFCEGRYPLRYSSAKGDRIALHASALGKAILAVAMPSGMELLEGRTLKQLASGTVTDPKALTSQIAQFRKQGYALVENEGAEDLAALAVSGRINGEVLAISIAGPVGRLRLNFEANLEAVRACGGALFESS